MDNSIPEEIVENSTATTTTTTPPTKPAESHFLPSHLNPLTRRVYVRELLRKMPSNVQQRITLLKNLQVDYHELQVDYYREIFDLEKKYHEMYQHLYDRREKIVSGEVDPPKEEPKWKSENEELDKAVDLSEFEEFFKDVENLPNDVKGVPNFWLNIFRNSDTLAQIVYEHDVPALKALRDVKIHYNNENSFTLEFHFNHNPYFTNKILTKQYFLKNSVDKDYPFGFEGLEIYKCKGCSIDWKDKMILTLKTVRKREKHRETGAMRTSVKQVPRESFFNFFSPPEIEADKLDGIDDETQELLQVDFEIGHFLREEIIPKAVLYFTGDIIDDEDEDDSGESDDESAAGDIEENDMEINKIAQMLNDSMHN